MKIKRVLTALCCLFAALFLVTGIVDLTAKDKLYSALFKTVSYGYPIHGGHQTQLKKGDYVLCGTYDGEQLLWRVVSENGEVLQSEYIVDFAPFGKTSDWEKSDLKKELEKNIDGVVGDVSVLSKKEEWPSKCKPFFFYIKSLLEQVLYYCSSSAAKHQCRLFHCQV